MEGCLSTLIKLMILGTLFVVGLVCGYLYYQGIFDSYLIKHAIGDMPKLKVEEVLPLIDGKATTEQAFLDLGLVDRKWVRWRGQVAETRVITSELTQLNLLTATSPRRTVVVFVDHTLTKVEGRVGDEVEVVGWSRKMLVISEDREGRKHPQVLALTVKKVVAPQASTATDGELDAHGAEPSDDASAEPPSAIPPPSASAPATPAPSARSPVPSARPGSP